MTKTLDSLMSSSNFLKIKPSFPGATILGVPIYFLGGDKMRINDSFCDLSPEIHKALSATGYSGKTMENKNEISLMKKISNESNYTGIGDKSWKIKTFFTITLPKLLKCFRNKTFDELINDSDNIEGERIEKIVNPSIIVDFYTRLEVLLGLKQSGHTDTLTEASNLIDEIYKRSKLKIEKLYRNALDRFSTQWRGLPSKKLKQITFNTRP